MVVPVPVSVLDWRELLPQGRRPGKQYRETSPNRLAARFVRQKLDLWRPILRHYFMFPT